MVPHHFVSTLGRIFWFWTQRNKMHFFQFSHFSDIVKLRRSKEHKNEDFHLT